MWNRDGRNSALVRAQALLSAKRNDANATELTNRFQPHGPEAQAYGHTGPGGGSVQKSRFPSNTHILSLDLSDLSSVSSVTEHGEKTNTNKQGREVLSPQDFRASTSLGEGGGGQRFLKKAIPKAMASTQSPQFRKNQTQHPPERGFVASSQQGSQSAALSRLATIEERIRARQQAQQSTTQGRAMEGNPNHTVPPTAPNPGPSPPHGHSPPELPSAPLSPQLSSNDPGSPGKRFLKKTSVLATAGTNLNYSQGAKVNVEIPAAADAGLSVGKYRSGSAVKPSVVKAEPAAGDGRGVSLDSDEESMRKLLGDSLDSMEDRHRRLPMKTVAKDSREKPDPAPLSPLGGASLSSAHSPLQRSLSTPSSWGRGEVHSLEELFPPGPGGSTEEEGPHSGRSSSISSEVDFKFNIMSLDDFVPDFTVETKQKDHRPSKQHKAEDRTWTTQPPEGKEEQPGEEEVTGADYHSDFESLSIRTEHDQSPSEISEHLGASPEDEAKRKKKTQKGDDLSEISGDGDGSRREGGDDPYDDPYASSFSDRSPSVASSYTSGCSAQSSSRTLTPSSRRSTVQGRPGREAATQTRPDPLSYDWSAGMAVLGPAVGMGSVDPTPVASHTVGAEALEALTSYSPAVFALNNMLRQQLAMTRQFAQASRHLHNSVVQGLGPADYTYTTLEDTKQFIRKHRPPKLTVEQALEEVLQEMRDYHYI
ncbi:uncharacterized protein C19orf44 homolog isoform X1 [Gadus macrocephalus]|uniref:uncharacterized protein C19orf44 homolog isoform X1 n=1 Tax=Gadus macrocephalus TaxID=80720 RepID=UPI0028CB1A79|nr:uncharacterized protein C19orf44 homolog isoform X1 [Gadus macrocephalus]